jgi:hypothetical protein
MEPEEEIDLRLDKSNPGVLLSAGQPIYTVVDALTLGTSSPFYLDPGRAILWALFLGNADKSLISIREIVKPKTASTVNNMFSMFAQTSKPKQVSILQQPTAQPLAEAQSSEKTDYDSYNLRKGTVAINFMFPGKNKVLLELKGSKPVRFDQMINGDDPIELNVRFCPDSRYGAKLENKVAIYQPAVTTVDLISAKDWIDVRPNGTINTNISFDLMLKRRERIDRDPQQATNTFEQIRTNAIIICRPEQLFQKRTIYYLDWEKIWELYLISKVNNLTMDDTKNLFNSALPTLLIGGKEGKIPDGIDASLGAFPGTFILNLLAQVDETKDVIALCSVNRSFRKICLSSIGQRLLREKFQPWLDTFMTRVVMKPGEYIAFPGVPKPFTRKNHGLWPAGFVFFQNDFIGGNDEVDMKALVGRVEEVELENLYDRELSKLKPEAYSAELRRQKLVNDRIQAIMAARGIAMAPFGGPVAPPVVLDEERQQVLKSVNDQIKPQKLNDEVLNNIIRNSCSFISLFCMVKSMETRVAGIIGVNLHFNYTYRPKEGPDERFIHEEETKTERSVPSSSIFNQGRVLSSINDISLYNIDIIGITGSWLHETPVLPFFQNPDYVNILERVKTLEKERTEARLEFQRQLTIPYNRRNNNLAEVLSKPLINRLTILQNGEILALIEVTTFGGPLDEERLEENISIMFRKDINPKTLKRLRTGLIYSVYSLVGTRDYEYFSDDDYAQTFLSEPSDRISMRIVPFYITHQVNGGNTYYSQYMFLISFIRMMVLQEGGDALIWSVNI